MLGRFRYYCFERRAESEEVGQMGKIKIMQVEEEEEEGEKQGILV